MMRLLCLFSLLQTNVFAQSLPTTTNSYLKKHLPNNRTNDGKDEKLKINLDFIDNSGTAILADGTVATYNNIYSKNVTSEDVGKLDNIDENLCIVRANKRLTIEKRPLIDDRDTLFLNVYNIRHVNYRLRIIPFHFTAPALSAYLEDKFLQTKTPINLFDTSFINFSITSNTASADSNRFRIFYRPAKHFRSLTNGAWQNNATWQMSDDSLNWQGADIYPLGTVKSAVIRNGNTLAVTKNLWVTHAKVNTGGVVNVNSGIQVFILKLLP